MKKTIFLIAVIAIISITKMYAQQIQLAITRLDKANTIKDYQQLANDFRRIAIEQKTEWLPYYYAAFCNAKVGWLNQNDPDNIETFASQADEDIKKAQSLLDTTRQKKELSEVYCVLSMVNRARVFMNPATYGKEYGPAASQYSRLAHQANPENPRALYLEGWEKFYTPKMWGGDKSKAKELLTTAKQKLETNSSADIEPHWGKKEVEDILKQLK